MDTGHGDNSTYGYCPLAAHHVRLLKLCPGQRTSLLTGSLYHAPLDSTAVYEALSYTWGSPEKSSSLQCDDTSIRLTESLSNALTDLRFADRTRTLWIDQICIDQQDLIERSKQVTIMGDIYRHAAVVIAWIGEGDEETRIAVNFLPRLLGAFSNADTEDDTEEPDLMRRLGILALKSPAWDAFANLFGRPYFSRMWIVQEAALGCNVIVCCGSFMMDWNSMTKAARCLRAFDNSKEGRDTVRLICGIRKQIGSGALRPLSTLLYQTYYLDCGDPRDKIYGLLGVVFEQTPKNIIPDYNLPLSDLFKSVTKCCILEDDSLAILCNVCYPKKQMDLPSWVPDWTAVPQARQSLGLRYIKSPSSSDTGSLNATQVGARFSSDDSILIVKGVCIGSIRALAPIMSQSSGESVEFEWQDFAKSMSPYSNGETFPRLYWRTVIADDGMNGEHWDEEMDKLYQAHENLRERNTAPDSQAWEPLDEMSIVNSRALRFGDMVDETSVGRRMFTTDSGFIGLAPHDAELGDKVCVLKGAPARFVLRPQTNTAYHSLVGECFVQGLTDRDFEDFPCEYALR